MIVKSDKFPQISNKIIANICWMDNESLNIKKKYYLNTVIRLLNV